MVRGFILAALILTMAAVTGGSRIVFGDTYVELPTAIESKLEASPLPPAMIGALDAEDSTTVAQSVELNADGNWLIWTYSMGGEPFGRYQENAKPSLFGRTIVHVNFQTLPTELGHILGRLWLTTGYYKAATAARSVVKVRGGDGKLAAADKFSHQAYNHAQNMMIEMK